MKNVLYIYILSCHDDLSLDREWHFYSSLTNHNITTAFFVQINLFQIQINLCQIQINLSQIQINLNQIQINLSRKYRFLLFNWLLNFINNENDSNYCNQYVALTLCSEFSYSNLNEISFIKSREDSSLYKRLQSFHQIFNCYYHFTFLC